MLYLRQAFKPFLDVAKRGLSALGRGAKQVFWGLYRQDVLGLSAQVAYSALFSLFPFILLLNALVAYIPAGEQIGDSLLAGLRNLVSVDSRLYEIVSDNVFFEVGGLSATVLSLGVILTVWSASGAVMVLLKAVQRSYGLKETRPWHKQRSLAVAWALAGLIIIPIGVLLLVFGQQIGDFIGERTGVHSWVHLLWIGLRWPVVLILLMTMLGVFYRYGSSVRHPWYAVALGASFAVVSIVGVTQGLSWFLTQKVITVRWLTYGVIGSVIVLLFWAFMIGLMILIGAQINAVVWRRIEQRQRAGARLTEGEGRTEQLVESPSDE